MTSKALIILFSYHHKNTEKVAKVIAKVLDAKIIAPREVDIDELQNYSLIGFASGIYDEKHHRTLLELADRLPQVEHKKSFLFSTGGLANKDKAAKDHMPLREKLESKGYTIVGEFQCRGFNTNSFMKYLGGMNKGRPNTEDLKNAEVFARSLISQIGVE
ncbi:MAG: flavodoxin family protein [Candidatus Thorarchaeota archaeon]